MHYVLLGLPFAMILFAPWVVPGMKPLRIAQEND